MIMQAYEYEQGIVLGWWQVQVGTAISAYLMQLRTDQVIYKNSLIQQKVYIIEIIDCPFYCPYYFSGKFHITEVKNWVDELKSERNKKAISQAH